jgi:hypothetical protein
MFHDLVKKCTVLGERFSSFYSNGGMSLDIKEFAEEPSLDVILQYYRLKEYDLEDMADINLKLTNHNDLLKLFTDFYTVPNLGFSNVEIAEIFNLFINSVDVDIIIVRVGRDIDCYFIDLLASSNNNWHIFEFYYQYD